MAGIAHGGSIQLGMNVVKDCFQCCDGCEVQARLRRGEEEGGQGGGGGRCVMHLNVE